MKKYCGWKEMTTRDGAVIYTSDGSVQASFVKQDSVINYMFDKNSYGCTDATLLADKLWDIVFVLLHDHEQWMLLPNSHFVRRVKNKETMVFKTKEDFLEFLKEREMATETSMGPGSLNQQNNSHMGLIRPRKVKKNSKSASKPVLVPQTIASMYTSNEDESDSEWEALWKKLKILGWSKSTKGLYVAPGNDAQLSKKQVRLHLKKINSKLEESHKERVHCTVEKVLKWFTDHGGEIVPAKTEQERGRFMYRFPDRKHIVYGEDGLILLLQQNGVIKPIVGKPGLYFILSEELLDKKTSATKTKTINTSGAASAQGRRSSGPEAAILEDHRGVTRPTSESSENKETSDEDDSMTFGSLLKELKKSGVQSKPPRSLDIHFNYVFPGRTFGTEAKERVDYCQGAASLVEYLKKHAIIRDSLPFATNSYVKMEHPFWESEEKAARFCDSVANETPADLTDSSDNTPSKHPRSTQSDQSACETKGKRLRAATKYGPQSFMYSWEF